GRVLQLRLVRAVRQDVQTGVRDGGGERDRRLPAFGFRPAGGEGGVERGGGRGCGQGEIADQGSKIDLNHRPVQLARAGEDAGQGVVVVCCDRVELVVVAAGA